jgi:hypothetical protein
MALFVRLSHPQPPSLATREPKPARAVRLAAKRGAPETRLPGEAGPAANNPGPRAVLRRYAQA